MSRDQISWVVHWEQSHNSSTVEVEYVESRPARVVMRDKPGFIGPNVDI
jgi:hypothetical protein